MYWSLGHVLRCLPSTRLWSRTCQKSGWSSWYLGKVLLNLQPSELFIFSSSTKWNHHKAIYLDHISSAAHRNTFMSWDPLLHPQLLLSTYRKHHLLKNISTISTKRQLKAFSIMILNIRYIKFLLECTVPPNTEAYGWNCITHFIWQYIIPHPVSLCALVSRKLRY